ETALTATFEGGAAGAHEPVATGAPVAGRSGTTNAVNVAATAAAHSAVLDQRPRRRSGEASLGPPSPPSLGFILLPPCMPSGARPNPPPARSGLFAGCHAFLKIS
ncbi:MAG: hypothetical protein KY447_09810, partial [Actinobacteria bacterium]|nr:hypothetical protein [Actinomycetota bacterium]